MAHDDWIHEMKECPWCGGTNRSKPRARWYGILCANPWHNLVKVSQPEAGK